MDRVSPLGYIKPYAGSIVVDSNIQISKTPTEAKDLITKDYFDAKVPPIDLIFSIMSPFISYINLEASEVTGAVEIIDRPQRLDLAWGVREEFKALFNAPNFLDSKIILKEDGKTLQFLSAGTVSIQGSLRASVVSSEGNPTRMVSFFAADMRIPPAMPLEPNATINMAVNGAFKVTENQELVFSLRWPYGLDEGETMKTLDQYTGFTLVYYR